MHFKTKYFVSKTRTPTLTMFAIDHTRGRLQNNLARSLSKKTFFLQEKVALATSPAAKVSTSTPIPEDQFAVDKLLHFLVSLKYDIRVGGILLAHCLLPLYCLFHKTLRIRKLRICSYGQILTVNLLVNCQNCLIYGKMVVNYKEKKFYGIGPRVSRLTRLDLTKQKRKYVVFM